MNDELQAQVATILKQFSDGISTVGDVAMKELPDIAQQYVTYGFIKGILGVTISGAFLIAMICTTIWAVKRILNTIDDYDGGARYIPFIVVPLPLALFSSFEFYSNVENLILNITAPKLWLLLEIKNLVS